MPAINTSLIPSSSGVSNTSEDAHGLSAARIRIASINLFNFIEPPLAYYDFENIYTQEQWQKKTLWLSDFLQQAFADVVGFQEVFSPEPLAKLAHAQGLVHFAVVDEPELMADYIYRSPVVALASRHPIVDVCSVEIDAEIACAMGLSASFSMSRKVLRATIDLPFIGLTDCYVVHLKSMRPGLDVTQVPASLTHLHSGPRLLSQYALGRFTSSIQRGAEAAMLYHAMCDRRQRATYPMVLMGDFNDDLHTGVLGALTTQISQIHTGDIKDAGLGHLSDNALKAVMSHYQLQDSYQLYQTGRQASVHSNESGSELAAQHQSNEVSARQATHYYGAKGSVLDYILLSSEFDAGHGRSLAKVIDYQTFDDHLMRPDFERDAYSTDHAPVMVSIEIRN